MFADLGISDSGFAHFPADCAVNLAKLSLTGDFFVISPIFNVQREHQTWQLRKMRG